MKIFIYISYSLIYLSGLFYLIVTANLKHEYFDFMFNKKPHFILICIMGFTNIYTGASYCIFPETNSVNGNTYKNIKKVVFITNCIYNLTISAVFMKYYLSAIIFMLYLTTYYITSNDINTQIINEQIISNVRIQENNEENISKVIVLDNNGEIILGVPVGVIVDIV